MADPTLGLSEPEAAARLVRDGPNELGRDRRRGVLRIAREVLREPMFQLLIAAGLVYLAIGDRAEALILLGFALANVALVVVQESRTERVLDALRDLTSPRALVVRDGTRRRIAGREVVAGDILVLGEGDRVAADAILLSASDLLVDESLLTGESVPVRKRARRADETGMARPGGEIEHFLHGRLVEIRRDHPRALFEKAQDRRPPDAVGRTGDHRHFAV